MAHLLDIEFNKTYASKENAVKAFEKKFGHTDVRYMIVPVDDRFGVLALGENALQNMVHFHFNVVM